ncbi:dual oxidase maturation factor 1-like [Hyalella azteca]|uniref:Dual oxidase maturation factor 1-like n=1 Tax=Hyalella azteca TaxID=294128 RepID=A0A8B7NKZ1_HYAAZ|nr:dual oxidase maturation factor 1-like [Hyalella azteca]XP_018013936.1 dual oxidase maturation factor 1-like [Hyalella azteca]
MSDDDNPHYASIFTFARHVPFPTMYPEQKTAVTYDVLETGWIVAFCSLAVSLSLIVPVQPKRMLVILRVLLSLLLGGVIMACNFGHGWEVGELSTPTPYKPGSPTEIHAHIGVKFGLRALNITLRTESPPTHDLANETINYNEQFSWTWPQGRAGFGPFAGRFNREFRMHQQRGTPLPILWIAEYLTFDGEGIRFGRHYRIAGWYAHICIWAALPAWILTMILSNMVVRYGATMLSLTGACLTTAAILWASVRNSFELAVPFDPPHKILTTKFGVHWYLALIVGIVSMLTGLLLFILDYNNHDLACELLGINPIAYVEEEYEEDEGLTNAAADEASTDRDIEMSPIAAHSKPQPPHIGPAAPLLQVRYRSRGTSKRNWKTQQIQPISPLALPPSPAPLYADAQSSTLQFSPPGSAPPPPTFPPVRVTHQPATPESVVEEPTYGNVLPQAPPQRNAPYINAPQQPAPPLPHRR